MGRKVIRLLLIVLVLATTPILADVEFYGRVGYRNCYRPGEWTPVTVSAVSSVAMPGQIVVDVVARDFPPARYILPTDAVRAPVPQTIYVLMPERPVDHIDVRFVSHGRTRAKLRLTSLTPLNRNAPIVLNYTGKPHVMDLFKDRGLGFAHTDSGLVAVAKAGMARDPAYVEAPISGG